MNYARQSVEQAIFSTTDYSKGELSEMDLDELKRVVEILQHTDTDLDTEKLSSAISNLTE